jgi:hypothetical protein
MTFNQNCIYGKYKKTYHTTYFFPSGNLLSIKLKRTYLRSMLSVISPLKGHGNEIDNFSKDDSIFFYFTVFLYL